MKIKSVFVASDLSDAADEAIRTGHTWAERDGASLTVGFVVPEFVARSPLFPQAAALDTAKLIEVERRAAEELDRRVAELTGRDAGGRRISITNGAPVKGILDGAAAAKADLIVVGPDNADDAAVAERVARLAACPVLVARKGTSNGVYIAGTDLSDPSLGAVRAALAVAEKHGGRLAILHVIETPRGSIAKIWSFVGQPLPVPENRVPEARAQLHAWLDNRGGTQQSHGQPEVVIVEGDPAEALVELAETREAELLVIGTRGWTGEADLPLGSVAEEVLRTAKCSVLVVRL
jgi:nucleotide-binding universal stress UspA family protein